MKTYLAALIIVLATAPAFSQGTVIFDNSNITTGPARVGGPNGSNTVRGTNYAAQLYSAPGVGQPESSLTAAEGRVNFREGAAASGFIPTTGINLFTGLPVDAEVTVTPVLNGPATIQMRAWEGRFTTYEAAVAGGGYYGASPTISLLQTGGGLLPPVELTGLQGFSLVPEPSIIALSVLGFAALLFRRKS